MWNTLKFILSSFCSSNSRNTEAEWSLFIASLNTLDQNEPWGNFLNGISWLRSACEKHLNALLYPLFWSCSFSWVCVSLHNACRCTHFSKGVNNICLYSSYLGKKSLLANTDSSNKSGMNIRAETESASFPVYNKEFDSGLTAYRH